MANKSSELINRTFIKGILLSTCFLFFNYSTGFAGKKLSSIEIFPDKILQGDACYIKISGIPNTSDASVTFDNNKIALDYDNSSKSYIGFIGIGQNTEPGERNVQILFDSKTKINKKINIQKKDFQIQHLTLPKTKVDLSDKNLKRHNKEKKIVTELFANSKKIKLYNSKFIKPIDNKISTPFGVKRFMNKKPKNSHSGIDLKAKMNDPVKSINKGVIVFTGNHFFSGNSVYIDHGLGIVSMYFHLSEIKVKKGDEVNIGDVIGLVGSTGRSTGPHLHWGVRVNNIRVDPLSLINLNKYF
jgi:murein DD-endopeptidase MepM/ murein hydrolase activator NlpD